MAYDAEYYRQYCINNKERIKEYKSNYYNKNKRLLKSKELFKKYGITLEQYKVMLDSQNGQCKICHKSEVLYVDHCHETGKVRGLLCNTCNMGLGHLGDDLTILQSAVQYLQESLSQ